MTKATAVRHEFVEFIPEELEDLTVYVSIPYATVAHKCCCGCGSEVVTPLTPTDWRVTFDGETVSLVPSIGNWSYPCKSHYWIDQNRVRWAGPWSERQIKHARRRDLLTKERYFRRPAGAAGDENTKARAWLRRFARRS